VLARTYELFTFPFTGIGSTTKKLREKPEEVKRIIKAGIRANRYVRQNRDGAIQVMMEWGKTDREAAANTYESTWRIFSEDGGMTENGLRMVIDQAKQSMSIDRPVAISDVADFNFVRDAQRELGIKAR
jgi:ABC-type nitrate/sulfonate/bicarbonate transport system substrate-binding protein